MKTYDAKEFCRSVEGLSIRGLLDQESGLRVAVGEWKRRADALSQEIAPVLREIESLREAMFEKERQLRDLHDIIDRAYEQSSQ